MLTYASSQLPICWPTRIGAGDPSFHFTVWPPQAAAPRPRSRLLWHGALLVCCPRPHGHPGREVCGARRIWSPHSSRGGSTTQHTPTTHQLAPSPSPPSACQPHVRSREPRGRQPSSFYLQAAPCSPPSSVRRCLSPTLTAHLASRARRRCVVPHSRSGKHGTPHVFELSCNAWYARTYSLSDLQPPVAHSYNPFPFRTRRMVLCLRRSCYGVTSRRASTRASAPHVFPCASLERVGLQALAIDACGRAPRITCRADGPSVGLRPMAAGLVVSTCTSLAASRCGRSASSSMMSEAPSLRNFSLSAPRFCKCLTHVVGHCMWTCGKDGMTQSTPGCRSCSKHVCGAQKGWLAPCRV